MKQKHLKVIYCILKTPIFKVKEILRIEGEYV